MYTETISVAPYFNLTITGEDTDPMMHFLWRTVEDLKSCDRIIKTLATNLSNTIARINGAVTYGTSLNPLGEIQSNGTQMDLEIARRATLVAMLDRTLSAMQRMDGGYDVNTITNS